MIQHSDLSEQYYQTQVINIDNLDFELDPYIMFSNVMLVPKAPPPDFEIQASLSIMSLPLAPQEQTQDSNMTQEATT